MKRLLLLIITTTLSSLSLSAQDVEFEEFLNRARTASIHYFETFKGLIAEELRTYEYYREQGTLQESRRIRSVFVVYESPRDKSVFEYRNVFEFNGKNVARKDKDVVKLFENLAKASTRIEELARLRKEANRFDGNTSAYGMTLGQGFVLQPFYREFFEFRIAGREKLDGRDAVVVEYRQTKPTLRIKANATDEERKKEPSGISFDAFMPDNFRPTNPRVQGRLWLDAETAQLQRDEFFVTIQPAFLSQPVVTANFVYEYQASEFGILVPKKLYMFTYRLRGKSERELVKTKGSTKTFEYSRFSKPSSNIKETKIN